MLPSGIAGTNRLHGKRDCNLWLELDTVIERNKKYSSVMTIRYIRELAVDPSPVYRHSGGSYPNSKNYWFRVSAIFPQGESAVSEAYMPAIPNLAKPSAPTGKSYTNGDGTGYIDVQWNPVSGATGYKIWIFNGASYESLNVGNVTSWTTKGKKYWPTPAEVDAGRYQLHLNDSRGAELPVDPSWTYANAGTRYENSTNYWIRVSAYNSQGETVFSEAYMPRISPLPKPAAPLGVAFGYDDKKGTVELSWGRLEGATGYKVWIFNGKEYESIDVGNVNTWTTAEKGIWPRDEDIANGRYKLCLDGSGTELDINPSTLYTNADVKYANSNNYYFRISAYDQYGETVVSEAFVSSISPVTEKEAMIDNTPVDEEGWIEEEYEDIDITTDSEKVLKDLKENISETSDQIKELRDFPETTEIYNELSNVDIEEEVVKGEINNLTYQIENEKIIYSESSITESVQSNSVATNNLSFTSSEPDDTSEEIEEVFYDYPEDMFLPETIVNVDTNLVLVDSNTGETYSTEEYISQSVAKEQRDTVHTASYLPQLGYFLTKEVTYVKNAGTTNATIVHCSTVVQAGGNLRPNYFTVKASFLSSNDVNGPFDVAASTTKYNVKLLQDVCVEKRITSTKFWIGKTHITAHYKGGYTSQKVKMSEKFLLNKKGVIYPYYRDPRMRKVMKKPSSTTWDRVPKEQRVKWSTSQRDKYLDWYIENYGFIIKSFYEVHHIRPREYGGNNDYSNLIPLLSSFHRKVVNPWWTNYK
ncbi:HNH endonuclease signature motif containing protein [Anoxybacillus sp. PDR2]|uniref:HNH endonuclease signature motif containing protein n=1 Tax=Anoxybacillus sp. PDR2 TaxID=1636720 RepID=UPI001F1FCCFB|nr:HNH endonuclease [Anoxybacillus sp. PDR2]